jgi:hypothetical protein
MKSKLNRYRTYVTIELDILAKNRKEAEAIDQTVDIGNFRASGPEVEWGIVRKTKTDKKGKTKFIYSKLRRLRIG